MQLAHLGIGAEGDVAALTSRYPNVMADTSMQLGVRPPDDIVAIIRRIGVDRVLFGTDWPLCELATPLENWLALLKTIFAGETEANLTKFFQTNAERIYRV